MQHASIFSIKDKSQTLFYPHSIKIEQKKIKLNRTTVHRVRDKMNVIDSLDLCGNISILLNKDNLIKTGNLLGFEVKTCN